MTTTWNNDDVQDESSLIVEGFDPEKIEPQSFEPVPDGWYPVLVEKISVKPTADKTGKRANVQLKITDGDFKGRVIFDGINIINASDAAQQIGREHLAALFKACGKTGNNLAALVQCEVMVGVKMEVARTVGDKTYDARNAVKRNGYKPMNGAVTGPASAPGNGEKKNAPSFLNGEKKAAQPPKLA